jgi:hypothetical protein
MESSCAEVNFHFLPRYHATLYEYRCIRKYLFCREKKIQFLEIILRAKESELLEFLKIRTKVYLIDTTLISHLQWNAKKTNRKINDFKEAQV